MVRSNAYQVCAVFSIEIGQVRLMLEVVSDDFIVFYNVVWYNVVSKFGYFQFVTFSSQNFASNCQDFSVWRWGSSYSDYFCFFVCIGVGVGTAAASQQTNGQSCC